MRMLRTWTIALTLTALALPALADGRKQVEEAVSAIEQGKHEAALKVAADVPAGDPFRADAQFCVGYASAQTRSWEKAVAAYREVVKLRPDDSRASG